MQKQNFAQLLELVARKMGMSEEEVRMEMEAAMKQAMNNPDPHIQMRWKFVPRKGEQPTLEEFLEYLLRFT